MTQKQSAPVGRRAWGEGDKMSIKLYARMEDLKRAMENDGATMYVCPEKPFDDWVEITTSHTVQARLPARFVLFMLRDLKAERKQLDGFLSLGNEVGRAAEYDEWIAALEAYAAVHGIGAAAQGNKNAK